MAITALTLPSQPANYATPYDATTAFGNAQVIAANGYVNNVNATLDLGGAAPVSGAGRTDFKWCFSITNIKTSAGDESYKFHLLGSNDSAFTAGNVAILNYCEAPVVAAGSILSAIVGGWPLPIIPVGRAGAQLQRPSNNRMFDYIFRYVRCYVVVGGTGPTITLSSWLSWAGVPN